MYEFKFWDILNRLEEHCEHRVLLEDNASHLSLENGVYFNREHNFVYIHNDSDYSPLRPP